MPYAHRLQGSRYELKYLLDEPLVRPLRDFARSYLQLDEHADPRRGNEYEVHSLYLDSPALKLCRATLQGQKNRFKLRIRFYDFRPESPVFFEVKRRVSDVILKQRAAVRRDAVDRLLAGLAPPSAPAQKQQRRPSRRASLSFDIRHSSFVVQRLSLAPAAGAPLRAL